MANSASSSTASMLLPLVMAWGYLLALTDKLQAELESLYNRGSSSNSTSLPEAPTAPTSLSTLGDTSIKRFHERGGGGEGNGKGGRGGQQPHDLRRRESEDGHTQKPTRQRFEFSTVIADLRRLVLHYQQFYTNRTDRAHQQQQRQQLQQQEVESRSPAFTEPSASHADVNATAAAVTAAWPTRTNSQSAVALDVQLASCAGISSVSASSPLGTRALLPAVDKASRPRRTDKTLCLEIDETLVHARGDIGEMGEARFDFMMLFPRPQQGHRHKQHDSDPLQRRRFSEGAAAGKREAAAESRVGPRERIFVRRRPHVREFLEAASEMFEVVILTGMPQILANALVEQIDPEGRLVDHVVSVGTRRDIDGRGSGGGRRGKGGGGGGSAAAAALKDLGAIGRPLSKVIMVDNSSEAIRYHLENGVHISSFQGNRRDTELLSTLEVLKTLAPMADVRDGIIRLSVESQARGEGHKLLPDGSIAPAC